MRHALLVVTVAAIVAACGPDGEGVRHDPRLTSVPPSGSSSPVDGGQQPAGKVESRDVKRVQVAEGVAAVELEVSPDLLEPGDDIEIVLTNHGDLELLTGEAFAVERWDGTEWVDVTSSGSLSVFHAIGIVLRPDGAWSESWPSGFRDDRLEAGQYRVVKAASYETPDRPDQQFVLRAGFEVGD